MRYFIAAVILLATERQDPSAIPRVAIVSIAGEIGHKNVALVRRAVRKIKAERPARVIFEIDTPGGRIDHMLMIGEEMMSLGSIPTVAYVRPLGEGGITGGAWSAGAYLAISCKRLFMYPGTVIGAATPVAQTGEGVKPVEEKYVSAFREKFRARAEQNGYPPNLAVAMVDKDLEIWEVVIDGKKHYVTAGEIEKLKNDGREFDVPTVPFDSKDKLLTMTHRLVEDTGMGAIAESRAEIYSDLGIASPVEDRIEATWSEGLVGVLTSPIVSMLLLAAGLLGIWVEIKTPGFGFPGIAGILAVALLLFGHHLAGLAEVPEILLFAAGVALLAVEIFLLPGTGVFAILGVASVLLGLVLSFQDFTFPDMKGAPWQVDVLLDSAGRVILSFLCAGMGLLAVLRFLPKVPLLNKLVLEAEISGSAPEPSASSELVGRFGHAVTTLKPGGKVAVNGHVLDVVADGEFVAPGEPVEILRIEGMRIVVARLKR
jgi:membrane-bound serine protease (ClpP class)